MYRYDEIHAELADDLLNRFLRYVKVHTTSDGRIAPEKTPSTECQWKLIRMLEDELRSIGIETVEVDENGFLIARIPGNLPAGKAVDTIGFMAHVDTSSDAPGENVMPIVHERYDGGVIELGNGIRLDPAEYPGLERYRGETIVTAGGGTLLGADDKAGVAEIVTAAARLIANPEVKHGNVEIIFTPDEETGAGMNRFPVKRLESAFCFTMDGGEEGELESECYFARKAHLRFTGRVHHPGSARGKLVNAVSMACAFVSMIPRNESPEATDGRYGNYWPHSVEGGLEHAELTVMYRSFDLDDLDRRSEALGMFAAGVEAAFPGGKVDMDITEQYRNMREELDKHPELLECARRAFALSGVEPIENPIRGGTDGARLTAMGVPTPNIFAGGQNFHSRSEWAALPAMTRAVTVILNIITSWSS